MKSRRTLIFLCLLLCTFLAYPGFQLSEFGNPYQVKTLQEVQLNGLLSHLVNVQYTEDKAVPTSSIAVSNVKVSYKLFGIFPLKTDEVQVMPSLELIPGGQSIGVTLQARGVMIVGQAPVIDKEGKKNYPAKEMGIQIGDTILKINGQDMHTDQDVANAVNLSGKESRSLTIIYEHQGQKVEKTINPIFCQETNRYRIGLYVRDEAAGVGTLTFVDPATKNYGALGHVINDNDTNQRIEVSNGQIIASTIYAIEKGGRGHPGEKVGTFVSDSPFKGTIEKNTATGIFGKINGTIANPYFSQPIPVAWESDIEVGPAKIYTVLKGEKVEEFDVKIERIMHNRTDSKNMVITVTDPRLLQETGGIIQGMSGSPIVQNGKLIGAVTHVFVNDSTRGYGVLIQNMLNQTSIINNSEAA